MNRKGWSEQGTLDLTGVTTTMLAHTVGHSGMAGVQCLLSWVIALLFGDLNSIHIQVICVRLAMGGKHSHTSATTEFILFPTQPDHHWLG